MFFSSDREFQLWDYFVSHGQLLLRSPRTPSIETNIDIVFWGVQYLELAVWLSGVALLESNDTESRRVLSLLGRRAKHCKTFVLESGDHRYLVVAHGVKVLENQLDIFVSSLCFFEAEDKRPDYGQTLFHSERP